MKVAALSFGNSRISAASLENGQVKERADADAVDRRTWPELLDWLAAHSHDALVAAVSVNPSCEEAFRRRFGTSICMIGRDREIAIRNLTRSPEQTGPDRLLCSLAASKIYGPPLLVLDFGTAMTFNWVDGDGAFRGGAIAPGPMMAAKSLGQACAKLPEIRPAPLPVPLVGLDTESAVQSGLMNGILGTVTFMINRFREEAREDLKVVATGGGAWLILPGTPLIDHHDPDLLLKGVALAAS